jgi:hypothetical protein
MSRRSTYRTVSDLGCQDPGDCDWFMEGQRALDYDARLVCMD